MDSILLGGDSSDEESANNRQSGQSGPAAAPAPPPPATVQAPAPSPAQSAPTPPADPPPAAGGGGNDLKERLKFLYSPAQQQHRARTAGGVPPSGAMQPQSTKQASPAVPPQQQQHHPHHAQLSQQQQRPPAQQPQISRQVAASTGTSSRQSSYGGPPPSMPKPGGPPPRGASNDPFAPTPVSQMRGPQQTQHRSAASSSYQPTSNSTNPPPHLGRGPAQYRQPPSGGPSSMRTSTGSGSSSSTMPASNRTMPGPSGSTAAAAAAARERDLKKQKETFLLFTRVLIKYLEQKDPHVHQQVKAIIKDCAERNKRGEPGYESVTASMRSRLKRVVSESYWSRAEAYLRQLLSQKRGAGTAVSAGASSATTGGSSASSSTRPPSTSATLGSSKGALPPGHSRQPTSQPPASGSSASSSSRRMQPTNARSVSAVTKDIRARQATLAKSQPPTTKHSAAALTRPTTVAPAASGVPPPASTQPPPFNAGQSSTASTTSASSSKKSSSKRSSSGNAAKSASANSPPATAQRKSSMGASSVATTTTAMGAAATEPVDQIPPVIIKEYSENYELLDHAMNIKDWQSTPLVLGQKTHAMVSEEQKQLLYRPPQPSAAKKQSDVFSFPRPGWGQENILSVRNAWAKIRLREKKLYGSTGSTMVVPTPSGEKKAMHVTSWFNEDVNEEDGVLAALSEGTQAYIKSILEKAIYCARQRQNVDGIRLWHSQVINATSSSKNATSGNGNDSSKEEEPSLTLRLGCDVQRQVARGAANAALVNKRMEEALERQTDLPARKRLLNQENLEEASSMSEISLRPRLARGVDEAEIEAARANEIAGGKYATEPPLGRIPKKAKLEVVDFQNGMQLALRPGLHRASVVSGAFSF